MENASMKSLAPHFESILDTLSDGVFISDVEGTTLFVNKMYETLTGLRQGEIRGKNIRTLVQQGTFDKVVNPQIVETGKPATHVQQLANGKRLVLTGHPVFDDKGQLCLVVTFARDITVLTQLQEEMTAQKKLIEQFHDRLAFLAREQTRELVPVFESREMKEARTWWPASRTSSARARKRCSSRWIAAAFPKASPNRSSSATCRGPLPERATRARAAILKWPTAVRYFSTKSAN